MGISFPLNYAGSFLTFAPVHMMQAAHAGLRKHNKPSNKWWRSFANVFTSPFIFFIYGLMGLFTGPYAYAVSKKYETAFGGSPDRYNGKFNSFYEELYLGVEEGEGDGAKRKPYIYLDWNQPSTYIWLAMGFSVLGSVFTVMGFAIAETFFGLGEAELALYPFVQAIKLLELPFGLLEAPIAAWFVGQLVIGWAASMIGYVAQVETLDDLNTAVRKEVVPEPPIKTQDALLQKFFQYLNVSVDENADQQMYEISFTNNFLSLNYDVHELTVADKITRLYVDDDQNEDQSFNVYWVDPNAPVTETRYYYLMGTATRNQTDNEDEERNQAYKMMLTIQKPNADATVTAKIQDDFKWQHNSNTAFSNKNSPRKTISNVNDLVSRFEGEISSDNVLSVSQVEGYPANIFHYISSAPSSPSQYQVTTDPLPNRNNVPCLVSEGGDVFVECKGMHHLLGKADIPTANYSPSNNQWKLTITMSAGSPLEEGTPLKTPNSKKPAKYNPDLMHGYNNQNQNNTPIDPNKGNNDNNKKGKGRGKRLTYNGDNDD